MEWERKREKENVRMESQLAPGFHPDCEDYFFFLGLAFAAGFLAAFFAGFFAGIDVHPRSTPGSRARINFPARSPGDSNQILFNEFEDEIIFVSTTPPSMFFCFES
jgi:hypothetical protein